MNNTFLLFYSPQASEPSTNFNIIILKMVYFVFEWVFFFEGFFGLSWSSFSILPPRTARVVSAYL